MKTNIPSKIKSLLWDIDISTIDLDKHYKFIIERVIEYGDIEEVKWMQSTFSKDQIIETLKTSKRISAKSGNFFAIKYNLSKEELECLRNPFTQKQNRF